nr:glycosyltransferase [Halobaculum sp. SYNS20]
MSGTDPPPRVAVVVPTYGRPEFLVEAVESVADQTYPNLELVVVDDHSPEPVDPTLGDASLSGVDWRCIRHEENRGGERRTPDRDRGRRRADRLLP